jgi:hypothetical protein
VFWQAGLFQYSVSQMTRRDVIVDGEISIGARAVPDFVIALSLADEMSSRPA